MEWDLQDVLKITGARLVRWPKGDRVRIVKLATGPGTLYFPLTGPIKRKTVTNLHRAGAAGLVLHEGRDAPWLANYPDLGVLTLPDPPDGYIQLATEARARSRSIVVGITGSSGKTSTKEYLASILKARYRISATFASFNLQSDGAGILLAMDGAPDEAAVIEMGFGFVGDIDRMARLAKPNAGIITKVTLDHLDGVGGSWERLVEEKGKLGRHILPDGLLVLNADDPGCQRLDRSQFACQVKTFGTGPKADARYRNITTSEDGTTFTLRIGRKSVQVRLQTYGVVQAANAAAAALVAHGLGLSLPEIAEGLGRTQPLPRRFRIHPFEHGLTVIDDTWSASVDAMTRGLQDAALLAGRRRKIAVLTGIGNLRDRGPELHTAMGRTVAGSGFTELILVAPDERTAAMRKGAADAGMTPEQIHEVAQEELPALLELFAAANTLIYCKTSQFLWVGPQIDQFLAVLPARGFAKRPRT